jgi:hypothetical protein
MNRFKNYLCQLLGVHGAGGVGQTEIHTAEPLVPDPRGSKFEVLLKNGKGIILQRLIRFQQKCYRRGRRRGRCILRYKTVILPADLYRCETLSLALREEYRLRVFENIILRRIFGPNRDEVTEEKRALHIEELNILYSSQNIIRQIKSKRIKWAGHVACIEEKRGMYKVLVGRPVGKRPLGTLRRK